MNLHAAIMRSFVERGFAPTAQQLSAQLGTDAGPALRALADDHGVVLHPGTSEIWVAHPFATAPTGVFVDGGGYGWWAPCLWCAFGIVSLVGDHVVICTRYGGERSDVKFTVTGDRVSPAVPVHFPIPPRDAWTTNVVHWCQTVQPFRDVRDIGDWAARHQMPLGEVVQIDRVLALARAWYGNHLAADWRKHTADEARTIFASVGLVGPHWELPAGDRRF